MSSSRADHNQELDLREFAELNARSFLLENKPWDQAPDCGAAQCSHGTLSPRPESHRSYGSVTSQASFFAYADNENGAFGGSPSVNDLPSGLGPVHQGGGPTKKLTWLAKQRGVNSSRLIYVSYYIPGTNWIRQYKWDYLRGDLIAALTMASFYIPMSLSYASNLGHIPPINGMYSFVISPLIYAILGSCPQMVVGPEAPGSLLIGNVVKGSIERGHSRDDDAVIHAQVAGIVTGTAGAIILGAGLARLGFLDNVLSRPFLRGFIVAIGFVILVDQLIPEMGLTRVANHFGGAVHGSTLQKLIFICKNFNKAHSLTCATSFASFAIIMGCREGKRRLQPRFPNAAYIPDRFLVVVFSALFAWKFSWDQRGLEILGDVHSSTGRPFPIHFPFDFSHLRHLQDALSTSFLIALLGFFESSVAAKSLGRGAGDGPQNTILSANRELVALGFANVVGGFFMALPAFGGYGRSKKGVLSAMISVVAYSLIEEAPNDIAFFIRIRGYSELTLMVVIFLCTIFYSLPLGIAAGIGLSLLRVIRHSTRPRIQILGRVPGTVDRFENAEMHPERLEFFQGCLIVKIPEPLTFANTGELKGRLERLESYGALNVHPALPRVRGPEHNNNIIFDVHGVTSLDGAGAQVLSEIVKSYRDRNVRVFFCRVPGERTKVWELFERAGIVEMCGGRSRFVNGVEEALDLTEMENLRQNWEEEPQGAASERNES